MNQKEKFISDKMKILVGKEGYSRPQAYQIALSYYEKEGQKAQQGEWYQNNPPMFSTAYGQQPLPQAPTAQTQEQYNISQGYDPKLGYTGYMQGDANSDGVVNQDDAVNPYTTNSVNILPPTQFGNPAYNLKQGMYNFGRGNTLGGIAGTGASLLGMARIGLSGYAEGKEDKRVGQEYMNKNFDRTQNYQYGQQGGKIKNSDIIAQNAITDNPQQNNVNLEGNEFVMRTSGMVQPVVGDPHIENGKKADGVDAQLNDGDKVLSNYVKLKPTDIKDLKERYDISLKRGATFAEAQKKLDQKLGIKKLETEKADILERIEKATKIKDVDSKQLSLEVLTKKTGEVNEKLNTLSGVRADNFEFLFQRQEKQEKIGDGTQLFDKNGKEVTESNEEVAQQGVQYNYQKAGDTGIVQQDVNRINKNSSIEFTPDFAQAYFSTASTPPTQTTPTDYSQMPVLDITSDGQWTDRKVWRTQRPEWFVGKQEPVEGKDYTRVPYKQWGEYQKGQEYRKFSGNNRQLVELQQGGQIETLAKKHGISIQRAQELMSFQQGGEQEAQIQQVLQMAAQMIQQGEDPNAVIEALIQQGVPHEISMQVVEQVMGQLQAPEAESEEQEEESEEDEQEEEMQLGGKKEYYEEGGKYSKKDQEERLNDFYNMASGLGYEGKKDIGSMQNWMADNYPDEVVKYFTENGQPLTAKHVDLLKKNASWVFKNAGISPSKASADYTEQEKKKLNEVYGQGDENGMLHEDYNNFLLKGFRDNKWDWRFPMIGQKPNTSAQGTPQAQITAPSMARFALPQEEVTQETPETTVEQRQEQDATPSGVKNILPVYDTFLPPTSALEPIAKNTYSPYLYENKKMTVEPMLAEQARQAQTDIERAQQSGLSPQQQEALMGQASAANQMATNDAIYKTETYNADNAWKTDMANVDALNKSQIMNTQYLNDFAQKSAAALANKETERYNNAYSNFMQDQADKKYTDQMNKANMMSDQFALTPNQGIIALNNKPAELPKMYIPKAVYDKMTAEEVNAIKKKAGATGMQLQIS